MIRRLAHLFFLVLPLLAAAQSYEDFFNAVKQDSVRSTQNLLGRGFDPNTVDPKGRSGLMIAIHEGSPKVGDLLVSLDQVDVNFVSPTGESALMLASLKGQEGMARKLIGRGAKVHKAGWTPLHYAASGGHVGIVRLLIEHNAIVDSESPNGTTPLMMAAQYGNAETVRLLLEEGAQPDSKNRLLLTALDFARMGNRSDAIAILTQSIEAAKTQRLPASKVLSEQEVARFAKRIGSPSLRRPPWKERLDKAVQAELKEWLAPDTSGLEEVPPPPYPLPLLLKQDVWETNKEFEARVDSARSDRGRTIEKIQTEYRARVEQRNQRVYQHNKLRQEREALLAQRRRELILLGLNLVSPPLILSDAGLDQQTGVLSLLAQIDGIGQQVFLFNSTSQDFRRVALTDFRAMKAVPEFQVSDSGDVLVKALAVESGGTSMRGIPSSAGISPIKLATVTLSSAPATVITQQSAVTVDRNQIEQILYRDENDSLRKRLEEQRKQQEQALAAAEARAAAEIARIRAEAEAQRKQLAEARPLRNVASVQDAHALVIGNSAYPGSTRLENPVNDARAVAAKLRSLGFKVTEVSDASREQMVVGLSEFSKSAARADLTLLFYAGHGAQIQGVNYMVPVDMSLSDSSRATLQAVSLTQVVEQYLPGKTKLVFLDACRDNPLMNSGARGVTRGLAPINVSEGTLISYATKDGQTAEDGTGQANSPFTSALLEHLADPEDIGIILRTVRSKVMQRTNNRQQPWEYGSLTGGALVLSQIKPR